MAGRVPREWRLLRATLTLLLSVAAVCALHVAADCLGAADPSVAAGGPVAAEAHHGNHPGATGARAVLLVGHGALAVALDAVPTLSGDGALLLLGCVAGAGVLLAGWRGSAGPAGAAWLARWVGTVPRLAWRPPATALLPSAVPTPPPTVRLGVIRV